VRPSSRLRKVIEITVREGGVVPPLHHVFEG
jgi:3-ketosteroid 9alpha-monooxygenase subunit A